MPRTGRPSSIDKHPERVAVEACLARKTPLEKIAKRYGLTTSSLHRHREKMKRTNPKVFAALTASDWNVSPEELEKLRLETGDGWLKILRSQADKLIRAQDEALGDDRLQLAATIAGRAHEVLGMLGKATDNLRDHATVQHSHVHYSPVFIEFRTKVIHALRGFPDARAHLLATLHEEEAAAVQDNAALPLTGSVAPVKAVAA